MLSGSTAGKSTLLQILAGKKLVTANGAKVFIKGRDVFRNTPPGVTHLGTEWYAPCSCWVYLILIWWIWREGQ